MTPYSIIDAEEIEKNKKDVASLNTDLKLLASLLGRPVSQKDLPKLTKQASTLKPTTRTSYSDIPSSSSQQSTSSTTHTTKSSSPTNPALVREVELLQKIIQKQNEPDTVKESTAQDENKVFAAINPDDAYGKTNDALLATLLKQRGIGPAHNNVPVTIYPTTTSKPRIQVASRPSRPILDGLSWLWRTWQDTTPGNGGYQSKRTPTRGLANDPTKTGTSSETSFDDGLDSDSASV